MSFVMVDTRIEFLKGSGSFLENVLSKDGRYSPTVFASCNDADLCTLHLFNMLRTIYDSPSSMLFENKRAATWALQVPHGSLATSQSHAGLLAQAAVPLPHSRPICIDRMARLLAQRNRRRQSHSHMQEHRSPWQHLLYHLKPTPTTCHRK